MMENESGAGYLRGLLKPRKDTKYTAMQKMIITIQQFAVRRVFLVTNALLLLLILYTSFRFPHKYVRVHGECESNWLNLDATEESHAVICCDNTTEAPCYAGMNLLPVFSSTEGAWVIPMMTLIFNYVCVMLGPHTTMARIRPLVRRALLYAGLMAVRTFVLYVGGGMLERRILHYLFGSTREPSCWYAEMRHNKQCVAHFDHSDHLVLLVSHFLAISIFEWFALCVEIPEAWYTSVKKACLQAWLLLIGGMTVYMLFFTASYFHSPWENVVALWIAQACTMTPLYLLSQDLFAQYSKYLALKHFIRPPVDAKKHS